MNDKELREFAAAHGFTFIRMTGAHYILRGGGSKRWNVEVWPTKPMLRVSSAWPHGPLSLERNWTLEDVVRAVAEKLKPSEVQS